MKLYTLSELNTALNGCRNWFEVLDVRAGLRVLRDDYPAETWDLFWKMTEWKRLKLKTS